MDMVNYWAILVSAISTFILGGLWYSPKLFGTAWEQQSQKEGVEKKMGHGAPVFVAYFIMSLIAAAAFALFLGPQPNMGHAIRFGLLVSICWVSTSFAVNYMFSGRGMKLFFIDAVYYIIQFLLYGIILGSWH